MQKLQDSVFSIVKTTNLSPAVFSFLQPTEEFTDKTPLGGILKDTKHGWLALGPKFCVVDLRTGLKVAARNFGTPQSNFNTLVTSVVELPRPLTANSIQLIISLQSDEAGMICILHVNGSQLLRCIQTEVVVTELAVWDRVPDGPISCFDGVVMAGTKSGEIFAFDLNRASLIQALKNISQGYEHLVQNEANPANLSFLQFSAIHRILEQRELALENNDHLAILLNENSLVDGQYIFRNPDGSVRMKAKRDHIRVTILQYIPQLGSLAVGYNFGAFQLWNIMTLELEFTSQVNVECLPVTHFGFQEPCDDPRAFCYLWVVFSVTDRFEEEEFPLAVMYSLTYQGKRMLSDTKCLYQEFSTATIRFQLELSTVDEAALLGGKCVSCHAYSVNSTLAAEGEESMLNICQIVWECWGENANSSTQYGMLLFDLDQWYKDQMPATWPLQSNAFMSVTWCCELSAGDCVTLDVRLDPASVAVYSHATRLEEHFYPNSLQYNCICLNTSEACVLGTIGIQRQIISSIDEVGPTALLNPPRLYNSCVSAGLTPLYVHTYASNISPEEQRRFLLSVALEARLSRFLKRCAHDWAAGSHSGAGCTLPFLVDWCWKRAIELKENAKELTAPLFASSALPDRNVVRCLEHCVQQLTQLTGLLDAVLTKCCNLIIPDALSEIEEKYKGIGTVSLYFQVVQWFLRVGLLPERHDGYNALPYPAQQLYSIYNKRRLKLNRLQDNVPTDENDTYKPCSLLYIDQLIEQEFGGERTHQLWVKGGSECNGLYPPPSLYSLLRLYLLPDIAEEHKHSLVLYLLVDYSMVYDEVRYEAVIRRLMQFPTMFGLSNTAIKATQAFWHLDHRDFDFALDQLQCLTGNTLSDWQHNVVLSTLLAQKKTQAALQYLHVRKPAPIQNIRDRDGDIASYSIRVNDHDKLEDWQSCCNLYLARGLVFEALDVIRMCVMNAGSVEDKVTVLQFFFKGCRNTGNLAKILQVTMSQFEEEMFVKYLEDCNEPHTSDILVMYYLQQSRYLEAERYNNKLKQQKPRAKDVSTSVESLFDMMDRENARDAIVEVVCASLPAIANRVAHYALDSKDVEPHVIAPKPMSVFVKAKSPKNTFTYKSSFIQDTIENASETWVNKPKMRRGIKRALNIEDTPFICTPKLTRTRSILSSEQKQSESTPPKRARLDLTGTPKTPKMGNSFHVSEKLSSQMSMLLDMPDVQSPDCKLYTERPGTPHSILKTRRNSDLDREAPSPVDSRYLGDSDDELLETASNHTHYSDANKHLRFTIPTASESGSTPSPPPASTASHVLRAKEMERSASAALEKEMDVSVDSFVTTTSHAMTETHPLESPPKKLATEDSVKSRKPFKDTVRARRTLSISVNSSLSDDPNTSIESIADIPVTLINPRYSGEKGHKSQAHTIERQYDNEQNVERSVTELNVTVTDANETEIAEERRELPKTPKGRRGIRAASESTPLVNRSRPTTPERVDSPVVTPLRSSRITRSRSRSRTPELSPRTSPLAPIPELPKLESDSEPHAVRTTLSVPRQLRSRSRTPERLDKGVLGSPKLEAITESPTKSSNTESSSSPSPSSRRGLRSRSRTPEIEVVQELVLKQTPRSLRSRSKTPEKLMSSRVESSTRTKKSLSRKAFENILIAKAKQADQMESPEEKPEVAIECTPMKAFKQVPSLMDVTLSPIVNKSVLQSSTDTTISESAEKVPKTDKSTIELDLKPLPAFTTLHETCIEKSILHSYESSMGDTSVSVREEKIVVIEKSQTGLKPLPAFTLNETEFDKSVLHSIESSVADDSTQEDIDNTQTDKNTSKPFAAFVQMIQTDFEKSVLHSAQSSFGEVSQLQDDSKQEPSSLMTNDSDVEMEENVAENKKSAAEQKEKEKIGEIEREIDEIQDMSDEEQDVSDESASDEEEPAEEESEVSSLSESSSSDETEEVISIADSDDSSDKLQIDEQSKNNSETEEQDIEIVEETQQKTADNDKETESKDKLIDEKDKIGSQNVTEIESSNDPLNQANFSLMTDDNSLVESDKSDFNLNYSGDSDKVNTSGETPAEQMETVPETAAVQIEISVTVDSVDSPKPIDTVPTEIEKKISESEQKTSSDDANNRKATESVKEAEKVPEITVNAPEVVEDVPMVVIEEAPKVVEKVLKVSKKHAKVSEKSEATEIIEDVEPKAVEVPVVVEKIPREAKKGKEKVPEVIEDVPMVTEEVPKPTEKVVKESEKVTNASEKATKAPEVPVVQEAEKTQETTEKEVEKPTRSRKRTKSTSSNKSTTEPEKEIETRTPATRKRTQSNASNKSIDPETKTPEREQTTPSRRRAKTPTSAEVRKIITRRVSREMSGKLDASNVVDETVNLTTPKRRSTRSRSKNVDDDNESVASESSFVSRASEDAGDRTDKPVRKGRKPVVVAKPELSVIPEDKVDEESKEDAENVISEYSSARRLTRHQKAVLESWLEPASPRRRLSTASRTSITSRSVASEADDDDASSTHSVAFDVQPIDRISLLNKTDFEGIPDMDELQANLSPESIASDASKQRRSRLGRAASETKTMPRAAKINRRMSVDTVNSPDRGSPVPLSTDSPARGRRKSFNRACEALHTPKGSRRTSTDVRKGEGESPVESPVASESEAPAPATPAPATPARRTRRAASTASNTSQANSETGKRSKRSAAVDESKKK